MSLMIYHVCDWLIVLEEGMGWGEERVARRKRQCSNAHSWSWEDFEECDESCWRDGKGTSKCTTCHCCCWGKSCYFWGAPSLSIPFYWLSIFVDAFLDNSFQWALVIFLLLFIFLVLQAKLSDMEKKINSSDNQVFI